MGPGCYVCGPSNELGLKLTFDVEQGDPVVRARFTPRAEHCGAAGFVHGGVLAACIDETMAAVGTVGDDEEARFVTAKLEVKYVRPVPLGEAPIRFEAWAEKKVAAGYEARGRAYLPQGGVAVTAKGLFARAPSPMQDAEAAPGAAGAGAGGAGAPGGAGPANME